MLPVAPPAGHASPRITFNPTLYPRTYTTSTGYRVFLLAISLMIFLAALFGLWYFGSGHEMRNRPEAVVFVSFCSFFLLLATYLALATLKFKIVLTADAIEAQELFSRKRLARSNISGWRTTQTQYVSTLLFVPRPEAGKKLKFAMTFTADDAFENWVDSLPNLDQDEQESSRAELASNLEIGLTTEQRDERIATAQILSTRLNWAAWITAAWAWFYPRPYPLLILILAALPLVAVFIGLRHKSLYQFDGRRNDVRPSLTVPTLVPSAVLALRALQDFHFVEWEKLIPIALFICFALTALISIADPSIRKRRWPVLGILLVTMIYAAGLVAHADADLDASHPQTFVAQIYEKHVNSGRQTSYHLRISPWGPQHETTDVDVPYSIYKGVTPGQSVCLHLYPGALRIPWYVASSCPSRATIE